MDHRETRSVSPAMIVEESDTRLFRQRVQKFLSERCLDDLCSLRILEQEHWFILEGCVDSNYTKSSIFSLVPKHEGAQWIVDRLRIGSKQECGLDE